MLFRSPYGKGFASKKDVAKLPLTPAHEHNKNIPLHVSWALGKALAKLQSDRYSLMSQFLTDLEKPNPDSLEVTGQPLLQRNPVSFWRTMALILLLLNLVQLLAR